MLKVLYISNGKCCNYITLIEGVDYGKIGRIIIKN